MAYERRKVIYGFQNFKSNLLKLLLQSFSYLPILLFFLLFRFSNSLLQTQFFLCFLLFTLNLNCRLLLTFLNNLILLFFCFTLPFSLRHDLNGDLALLTYLCFGFLLRFFLPLSQYFWLIYFSVEFGNSTFALFNLHLFSTLGF